MHPWPSCNGRTRNAVSNEYEYEYEYEYEIVLWNYG